MQKVVAYHEVGNAAGLEELNPSILLIDMTWPHYISFASKSLLVYSSML